VRATALNPASSERPASRFRLVFSPTREHPRSVPTPHPALPQGRQLKEGPVKEEEAA